MRKPSRDEALSLALMLQAGMPSAEAIMYFELSADPMEIRAYHDEWIKSRELKTALMSLQRKPWTEMSLDEKIRYSLDLHYAALAYFLYSNNYSDLNGPDKAKADTARQVLETKLAGLAGKSDAITRFFDDISSGVLRLPAPTKRVQ